jgi:hypothetical protein
LLSKNEPANSLNYRSFIINSVKIWISSRSVIRIHFSSVYLNLKSFSSSSSVYLNFKKPLNFKFEVVNLIHNLL